MEAIARSDLFFIITSVVVILIGALVVVAIIYIVKILRDVRTITHIVRDESALIKEDLDGVRQEVKTKGFKGLRIWMLLKTFFGKRNRRGRGKK